VILAPIMMTLEVAMDLMQPWLLRRVIDFGVARHDMWFVLHQGGLMIVCAAFGLIGGLGCGVFAILAAQGTGADVRHATFAKVQGLSFGNLDKLETGALVTRLTSDIVQIQDSVQMMLRMMVRTPLLLFGSLIMGILTSPRLSLLFLVLIPGVLALVWWVTGRMFPMFSEVQRRLDAVNRVLQENLSGIRVVKAFARMQHEIERFGRANVSLTDQTISTTRFAALTMPLMMLILNAGVVATLWYGGYQVAAGSLHVGQIVAFTNYLMQTLMSLMMSSMLIISMSRAEASAKRVLGVLETEPDVRPAESPIEWHSPRGEVRFENVSFGYDSDGGDPVLCDVSFTAEPGQTVAVLGATGSGKSSLVNLIPRFYDATQGQVTIDGIDVRELDEKELRTAVVAVLQESVLFSGTIADNIRFGRPDATDEEVEAAARIAQIDGFVEGLPDRYQSQVGQRGVNLSGGQKQRLAIARALAAKPRVLILDDSTSAVDLRTEARIQEGLAQACPDCTRFVVAQRVAGVLHADKILVLDDGRIVGEGTHEKLMASNDIYREIYESQMEGENAGA
jgi:ATP-binding cassette subfamily B protein